MKTLSIREMRGAFGQLGQLADQEGEPIVIGRGPETTCVMPSHAEHRSGLPRLSPSAELVREDRDA